MNVLLDREQGGQLHMLELQRLCDKLHERDMYLPLYLQHAPAGMESIPVATLLTEAGLTAMIDRVAARLGTDNRIAAASLFQKRYASKLLASILTLMTSVGVGLLADSDSTELVLEDDLPAGILLRQSDVPLVYTERLLAIFPEIDTTGWTQVKDTRQLRKYVFEAMFEHNMFQLIYHITSTVGLSPKVMWGNIGNFCAWLYDEELIGRPHMRAFALSDRHAVMNSIGYGAALSNTYDMVALPEVGEDTCVRVRHTCCLWNQMPGQEKSSCVTCPRLTREERVARLKNQGPLHK